MPSSEYTSAVGGGLKLKGSKPSGVTKKKKKSKTPKSEASGADKQENAERSVLSKKSGVVEDTVDEDELARLEDEAYNQGDGKTETERKYEEMKRKRLAERLQKSGAKTHKQRVEELNKYLSNLSEHHDMPKIGPG